MTEQTTTNMDTWKEIEILEIKIVIKILKIQWKHKEQFRYNLSIKELGKLPQIPRDINGKYCMDDKTKISSTVAAEKN